MFRGSVEHRVADANILQQEEVSSKFNSFRWNKPASGAVKLMQSAAEPESMKPPLQNCDELYPVWNKAKLMWDETKQ